MKPTDKKFIWEGAMTIYEQEGGYVESSLTIGGNSPIRQIEDAFEDTVERTHDDTVMRIPGKWRLTLERIDE